MRGMAIWSKWYHLSLCQIKNKGNHTKIGHPTLSATWHAKIGCLTCAIHQNNQLNKCVKRSHRASSQHQQSNKTPLITRKEQIKELYGDVFEGIGRFLGKPYHINLDKSVTPVQTRCRPVPVHLKEVFKLEINKMLNAGILKPVEKATPWINSFVLVKGKNPDGTIKLRICLDPTNLNKAVICEPYCSKTPEDIAHLFSECKGYHCHRLF